MKKSILSVVISGALLLSGCTLEGDDGAVGAVGATGASGPQGIQGSQGSAGENSTTGIELNLLARAIINVGGAAEIVQYHSASQVAYATDGTDNTIAMIDISGITSSPLTLPSNDNSLIFNRLSLPISVGAITLGGVTSIAISGNMIAVAVPAATKANNGYILFYNNLENQAPAFVKAVEVGNLPDMVTFTPDGSKVLVANEGEPAKDYSIDPEGSISVISVSNGVPSDTATAISFEAYNGEQTALEAQGMLFPNPNGRTINGVLINNTVAQDLEPEYITATNTTAYVTLQENNGLAIVDLSDNSVSVVGLGLKNWENLLIDSQEDGMVSFASFDGLYGAYQPDSIANFSWQGQTFLVTANEGDAREYFFDVTDEAACTAANGQDYDAGDGCLAFTDEFKIKNLPAAPGSAFEILANDDRVRNLRVTSAGPTNANGEYEIAVAYGARSFTIWDQNGVVVFDSADQMERITASIYGDSFNSTDDENAKDDRSENKGPEPEAITVGIVGDKTYAFVGLERMGGIMIFDITNPFSVDFVDYYNNRNVTEGLNFNDAIGDLAPESLVFIPASDSPTATPLLMVGNEVSGSLAVWEISEK
ncbi:MAG: choice-of-anchor I family protein [Glaciecola sp.]